MRNGEKQRTGSGEDGEDEDESHDELHEPALRLRDRVGLVDRLVGHDRPILHDWGEHDVLCVIGKGRSTPCAVVAELVRGDSQNESRPDQGAQDLSRDERKGGNWGQ